MQFARYPELLPRPNAKTPAPVSLNHLVITILMTTTTKGQCDDRLYLANLTNRNDGNMMSKYATMMSKVMMMNVEVLTGRGKRGMIAKREFQF